MMTSSDPDFLTGQDYQDRLNEKFGWKEGDVKLIAGNWTLNYAVEDGSKILVRTWDGLQQHLFQNDSGAQHDMKAAFYRFMRHNPQVPHMPDKLKAELQAEGLLP